MSIIDTKTNEVNLRRLQYVFFCLPKWWQLHILLEFDSFQNEANNVPLKLFKSAYERILHCDICKRKFAERIQGFDND